MNVIKLFVEDLLENVRAFFCDYDVWISIWELLVELWCRFVFMNALMSLIIVKVMVCHSLYVLLMVWCSSYLFYVSDFILKPLIICHHFLKPVGNVDLPVCEHTYHQHMQYQTKDNFRWQLRMIAAIRCLLPFFTHRWLAWCMWPCWIFISILGIVSSCAISHAPVLWLCHFIMHAL